MKPKTGQTRKLARERGCSVMWAPTGLARKKVARAVKRGLKIKALKRALQDNN